MAAKTTKTARKAVKKTPAQAADVAEAKTVEVAPRVDDVLMRHIKLHGKEFTGRVISDKMRKTVVVEWERRRLVRKYERYEKRYSRVYAHNTLNAKTGDIVRVKESRPISKTKNFVVVAIEREAGK